MCAQRAELKKSKIAGEAGLSLFIFFPYFQSPVL